MADRGTWWRGVVFGVMVLLVFAGVVFHAARAPTSGLDARPAPDGSDIGQRGDVAAGWYVERRLAVMMDDPTALAVDAKDRLIVAGDGEIHVINREGRLVRRLSVASPVRCLATQGADIVAGCEDAIRVWSASPAVHASPAVWPLPAEGALLTSLTVSPHGLFAADYAHRCVWRLDLHGRVAGVVRAPEPKGFRLPSPYFDVVWGGGLLWIADTGRHRVRAFSPEGVEQRSWGAFGMEAGYFAGCCNPSHLAMLSDGSFVTSEKGLPRIGAFKSDGEFQGLILPAHAEGVGHEPMDLAILSDGSVAALDNRRRRVIILAQVHTP